MCCGQRCIASIASASPSATCPSASMICMRPSHDALHLSVGVNRAVDCQSAVRMHYLSGDPLHLENADDHRSNVVGLAQPAECGALVERVHPARQFLCFCEHRRASDT